MWEREIKMLKVHYCRFCHRLIYTPYTHSKCRTCEKEYETLPITFKEFSKMNEEERNLYIKEMEARIDTHQS